MSNNGKAVRKKEGEQEEEDRGCDDGEGRKEVGRRKNMGRREKKGKNKSISVCLFIAIISSSFNPNGPPTQLLLYFCFLSDFSHPVCTCVIAAVLYTTTM